MILYRYCIVSLLWSVYYMLYPVQSFDVEFVVPVANTVIGMECLGLDM